MEDDKIDQGGLVDNKIPKVQDPLLERVKNTFFAGYFPIFEYRPGVIFMSTQDIYNLFLSLYPNPLSFTADEISMWMHEKGFQFIKMKELEYQWMLLPEEV